MTPETLEGNKSIARFLGFTYFPHNMEGVEIPGWKTTIDTSNVSKFNQLNNIRFKNDNGIRHVEYNPIIKRYLCRSHNALKYHTDWNWMMEAINKIESMKYNVNILRTTCSIYDDDFKCRNNGQYQTATGETKHEGVWLAVNKFLKNLVVL